ncbi:MAG: PucR family transcriptional regulator [Enterococcus avium]
MNVYLVKEHEPLTPAECEQSVELIQVALNLWGKKHGEVSEHGLVKAILNDESEKMYRLANKLSIDVKSINLMWLFQLKGPEKEKEIKAEVLDYVTKYYHTSIVQLVEDQLIVLLGNYRYNEQEVALSENFLGSSQFVMEIESLAVCPRLRNTTDVRKNYQLINSLKEELSTLFIGKKHFTISEVRQVQQAILYVRSGEVKVDEVLRNIQPIIENTEQMHTLCTFLLDADADYQKCGEYLFIHKNTVKYRIKRINELLGCDVTRISDSYEYSITCLVYRIVRRSNLL